MTHITAVSAVYANPQRAILLQLRDTFPHLLCPGMWTVPGGHVEAGETPQHAIQREMHEEMELHLSLTFWRTFITRRGPHKEITVTQHMYVGTIDRPAEDIPLHEGQRLAFFTQHQLHSMELAFGFGPIIDAYFEEWTP